MIHRRILSFHQKSSAPSSLPDATLTNEVEGEVNMRRGGARKRGKEGEGRTEKNSILFQLHFIPRSFRIKHTSDRYSPRMILSPTK